MKFKEATLRQFAAPLSDSENDKCKHAIEAIRDALKDLDYTDDQKEIVPFVEDTFAYSIRMRNKTSNERIQIFVQGSYANNTCVRNESDVDIAVVREDIFECAFGLNFDTSSAKYKDEAFELKSAVEIVLKRHFPYSVRRGNKSIKVDGNTYRKKADTVPCISMRYYYKSHLNNYSDSFDGIVIYADDGSIIRNFPKQHIINGKVKNKATDYYFKKMVRIIKKMRHLMSDSGDYTASKISSFCLESLLWNFPDSLFKMDTSYGSIFKGIVEYAYDHKSKLSDYYEANGIKPLCATQQDVRQLEAFIDSLYLFYDYDYSS